MVKYKTPSSIQEALEELNQAAGKGIILAGGTDLIPDLHAGNKTAEILIDITQIPELRRIKVEDGFVSIGAAVTFAQIKNHPELEKRVPMLIKAAASVGAGGIQQIATWVGNIIQGMPAADGVIAALALESQVLVINQDEENWLPVENLYQGVGESVIDPTKELVAEIQFPLPEAGDSWGSSWRRVGRRSALILPIINCAGKLHLDISLDKIKISKAVLALGPSGAVPFRARETENFLAGKTPQSTLFVEAGQVAKREAQPRTSRLRASREYRQSIIPAVVCEVLERAYQVCQINEIKDGG
jgi:carbon-monoxide dehydrogenase medium subunit